jgi:hypothetical protein
VWKPVGTGLLIVCLVFGIKYLFDLIEKRR